jgi:hypothetical protein
MRRSNLGSGDFNNDLTISDTPGNVWSCSFVGTGVAVIAPKEPGAGTIEIQIDGRTCTTADLSTAGPRQSLQKVFHLDGLEKGEHTIRIIHCGPGPAAVDALIVQRDLQDITNTAINGR